MTLSLEEMPKEEKLRIMEALWIDLTKHEEEFLSPNWHEDVLKARERRVQSGQEEYRDWEIAKKELAKRLS
ncbi:MAG: addiction module protein [Candidatus Kryptoniota bacterium]